MAVIKILNDNQAFRPTHSIHEKTNTSLFQKHCLRHILLFIKTNTDVNAMLILLIIFPPMYQTAFFQNINIFMQIREGFLEITSLLQTISLFYGVKQSNFNWVQDDSPSYYSHYLILQMGWIGFIVHDLQGSYFQIFMWASFKTYLKNRSESELILVLIFRLLAVLYSQDSPTLVCHAHSLLAYSSIFPFYTKLDREKYIVQGTDLLVLVSEK